MNKVKLTDGTELTFNKLAVTDLHDTPYVMMLLREKKLNSEDVPEELLSLKDNSGTSVLDICIERFKESVPDNNGRIMPRVFHLMNSNKCKLPLHFRKVKEILRIARENGWSVAHEMASLGYFSPEMMIEDILKLTNASGCSVAYYAAKYTFFPDWAKRRRDILLLGDGQGTLVAHVLVEREKLPSEMMTEEVLKLTDASGCTVAYYAAVWKLLPDWAKRRKDILLLGNGKGDYVAHVLARRGILPVEMMTKNILCLENKKGITVLAALVSGRHLSPEILMLPWGRNTKVFEHLLSEQFLRQVEKNEIITYVKEEIIKMMQIQSIAELSIQIQNHDCNNQREMER